MIYDTEECVVDLFLKLDHLANSGNNILHRCKPLLHIHDLILYIVV